MSNLSFLKAQGLNLSRKSSLANPPQSNTSRFSMRQKTNTNKSKSFQPNIEEMKTVFDKYDTNKDGKISREEYKSMVRAMNGKGIIVNTEAETTKAFQVADKDADGFVDFNEFMELHNNKVKVKDIENAFRVFDSNGDGKISASELMEVLRRMGERYSLESCKKMIKEVDNDGDGLIDMDEFNTMMTRTMKLAN